MHYPNHPLQVGKVSMFVCENFTTYLSSGLILGSCPAAIGDTIHSMSSKYQTKTTKSKLVLRRVAIRQSFQPAYAPEGVADFIESTEYQHKDMLRRTMSGFFDHQIPGQRPEWWIVTENQNIVGLALVAYGELNDEVGISVGPEHMLVAQDHRNKGVGTKIIRGLQTLARREGEGVSYVNLECEPEMVA